jgi:hypothetical protein
MTAKGMGPAVRSTAGLCRPGLEHRFAAPSGCAARSTESRSPLFRFGVAGIRRRLCQWDGVSGTRIVDDPCTEVDPIGWTGIGAT